MHALTITPQAGTARPAGERPARANNGGMMMWWRDVRIDGWMDSLRVERLSVFLMHGWLPPGPAGRALKMHTTLNRSLSFLCFFTHPGPVAEQWKEDLTSSHLLQNAPDPLTISDLVEATRLWIPNRPLPAYLVNQFQSFKLIKPII